MADRESGTSRDCREGSGRRRVPEIVETERVTGWEVVFYLDERASNGMIRISTDSESWFDFSLGD